MYIIYGKPDCGYCNNAKNLLTSRKEDFLYKTLDVDYTKEQLLELNPLAKTFPQIYEVKGNDFNLIGGFTELLFKLNR